MAIWYAQSTGVNISAWSGAASTVWFNAPSGGTAMPGANFLAALGAGDILAANGHNLLAIDASANGLTCLRLSNAIEGGVGSAGGYFTVSATRTIYANVLAGSTTSAQEGCIYATAGTLTVNGSVTGGTAGQSVGIYNTGATLVIIGDIYGGSTAAQTYGIWHATAAAITVTGSIHGGSSNQSYGIYVAAACAVTITGNVIAGTYATASTAQGISMNAAATITLTGNIINNKYAQAIGGVQGVVIYTPGAGNYIEYPYNTSTGVTDYGAGTAARPVSGQMFPRGV